MALTVLCGSHLLAFHNWLIMYNPSTLLVKLFFSHYIQQAWKKYKNQNIHNPDVLGNLEIPARTCPGKRRHIITLILLFITAYCSHTEVNSLKSYATLHYLHWYSTVPCIFKLHNLLLDCTFFLALWKIGGKQFCLIKGGVCVYLQDGKLHHANSVFWACLHRFA